MNVNQHELIQWSPGVTLATIEKQIILKAYRFYRGNATQTAISLGVSERTIRNKLEAYEQETKAHEQRLAEVRERERDFQHRSRAVAVNQPNGYDPVNPRTESKDEDEQLETQSVSEIEPTDEGIESDGDGETGSAEDFVEDDSGAEQGLHVEPALETSAKQPVPMPKRKKVQKVPQRKTRQVRQARSR